MLKPGQKCQKFETPETHNGHHHTEIPDPSIFINITGRDIKRLLH